MALDWDRIVAHALSCPGAERATHYGAPAVKANGHALVSPGREVGSFVLHIDQDTKAMLIETDPATFWETPHYKGWPSLMVRYDSADPDRVLAMVARAHVQAMAKKPRKPR